MKYGPYIGRPGNGWVHLCIAYGRHSIINTRSLVAFKRDTLTVSFRPHGRK